MRAKLNSADVEAHVDVLDRGEPTMPESRWKPSETALAGALAQVHAIQRIAAIPIAIAAAVITLPFILDDGPTSIEQVRPFARYRDIVVVFAFSFLGIKFCVDAVLKRLYPALDYEDRIRALFAYYRKGRPHTAARAQGSR